MKKGVGILFIVFGLLGINYWYNQCPCEKRISYEHIDLNDDIDLNQVFLPPSIEEKNAILESWSKEQLNSDSAALIIAYPYLQSRKLEIWVQYLKNQKHYGAILFPLNYNEKKEYPALLWAGGLNQSQPNIDLRYQENRFPLFRALDNYFIIIPSFRGQALVTDRNRYCSDGFFGDAYDGATSDALQCLYLAKQKYPSIDTGRLAAFGISRGGTVALLVGSRDTSIQAVISLAGPVDFHQSASYDRYTTQFKYQFLSQTKNMSLIREKLIKSSPIHFISRFPNNLLMLHGKNDTVVPLAQAELLINELKEKTNFDYHILDTGHRIQETELIREWLEANNF